MASVDWCSAPLPGMQRTCQQEWRGESSKLQKDKPDANIGYNAQLQQSCSSEKRFSRLMTGCVTEESTLISDGTWSSAGWVEGAAAGWLAPATTSAPLDAPKPPDAAAELAPNPKLAAGALLAGALLAGALVAAAAELAPKPKLTAGVLLAGALEAAAAELAPKPKLAAGALEAAAAGMREFSTGQRATADTQRLRVRRKARGMWLDH